MVALQIRMGFYYLSQCYAALQILSIFGEAVAADPGLRELLAEPSSAITVFIRESAGYVVKMTFSGF
jgi:hypothetical protein